MTAQTRSDETLAGWLRYQEMLRESDNRVIHYQVEPVDCPRIFEHYEGPTYTASFR